MDFSLLFLSRGLKDSKLPIQILSFWHALFYFAIRLCLFFQTFQSPFDVPLHRCTCFPNLRHLLPELMAHTSRTFASCFPKLRLVPYVGRGQTTRRLAPNLGRPAPFLRAVGTSVPYWMVGRDLNVVPCFLTCPFGVWICSECIWSRKSEKCSSGTTDAWWLP